MNNLWKKEITQNHTRYVDLFDGIQEDEQTADVFETMGSITFQKSNRESTELRMRGNELFATKHWSRAMFWYTQSLCFAEVGTENVALAYANRSACFFNLKMYDEAMVDIELAKKENLPDSLLPKLEKRMQECFELLGTVEREQEHQQKLDYEANQNFPCLADIVEIKYNQELGRHLIAKCDIPFGKNILMEEHYALNRMDECSKCYTCFCANSNFIACEHCVRVVFCSRECQDQNQAHEFECGTYFGFMCYPDDPQLQRGTVRTKLIIQTILIAISTFSDVERLMQFVENTLREDPEQLPTSSHDQISKYHFFFKLKKRMVVPLDDVKKLYNFMISLPKIRALFNCEEKQRFLKNLVAHHTFIVDTNSIGDDKSSSVINVFSLFNHSCEPNIIEQTFGKVEGCMTCKPVKKGEQLCINYLSPDDIMLPKENRLAMLKTGWGFECKCQKCGSTDESNNS